MPFNRLLIGLAAVASILLCPPARAITVSSDLLKVPAVVGERFSNIYSIAQSTTSNGFDAKVSRNSGSSDYTLTHVAANDAFTFDETDAYDGTPASYGETIIRDQGETLCWNAKCRIDTDASGLLYNRLLWGQPPAKLSRGVTWKVNIPRAWELGPRGTETVTVIAVDARSGLITLEREGAGVGYAANEPSQVTLMRMGQAIAFAVEPGEAHWTGYTTFKQGVVFSDELFVERNDVLRSADTGPVKAIRRRYVLLNAAPALTNEPTLHSTDAP